MKKLDVLADQFELFKGQELKAALRSTKGGIEGTTDGMACAKETADGCQGPCTVEPGPDMSPDKVDCADPCV